VIAVRVRHQDVAWPVSRRGGDRREVSFIADAGVDHRRMSTGQEVRPVPPAGHRAGISRMEWNNQKNTFKRP
jgi:hypothetical protein